MQALEHPRDPAQHHPLRWHHGLLALPVAASPAVPWYNRVVPSLAGVPFFYWFQLLVVVLAAILIGIVHRIEH
jgi:hypothetical protein